MGFLSTSLLRSSKISTNFAGNQPTKSEQRDEPDKDTEKSLHKAQWELRKKIRVHRAYHQRRKQAASKIITKAAAQECHLQDTAHMQQW